MIIRLITLLILLISMFTTVYMGSSIFLTKIYFKKKLLINDTGENSGLKKENKPGVLAEVVAGIKNRLLQLLPNKSKEAMDVMLILSGSKYTIEDIVLIKVLLYLCGLFVDYIIFINLQKSFNIIILMIFLPVTLGIIPDDILKNKGKKRQKIIKKSLPSFIDYLLISVEAGLGLDSAIFRVIKRIHGPLAEEIAYTMTEIQYGKTKKEAFKNLSTRVNLPELTTFLTSLVNAEQLGISLSNILRIQGQEIRQKRKQKVQEEAYKMAIKLLFPLVVFILPSLFVILLGPAVMKIISIFTK